MCDSCATIDAAKTRLRTFLGDRKAITWTPDVAGYVGDAFDWRITAMDNGEYLLHHAGETASFSTLDWTMLFVEMYRIMEGPPGAA